MQKKSLQMHISYVDQREYCFFPVVHIIEEERGKEGSTNCPTTNTFLPQQTTLLVLIRNYKQE